MKWRKLLKCVGAVVVALLVATVCAGEERPTGRPPQMLAVQFRGMETNWRSAGFDEADVRRQIEQRLRQAGYRLVSPDEAIHFPEAQFADFELHVNDAVFYYSFLVFLKLRAKQPLPQNPESFVTRVLWSDWEIGGIELHHLERLQGPMLELTDELINTIRESKP